MQMSTATQTASPPCSAITLTTQYSVPAKYTSPVRRPRIRALPSEPADGRVSDVSRGASAIQASAG
jgi:hypothetical protein